MALNSNLGENTELESASKGASGEPTMKDIARGMLLEGETDIGVIQKKTGLKRQSISGIRGQLATQGLIPKIGEETIPLKATPPAPIIDAPETKMWQEMKKVLESELDITPGVSGGKAKEYILSRFMSEAVYHQQVLQLYNLINKACPKAQDWAIMEVVNRVFSVAASYNLGRLKSGAVMGQLTPAQQQQNPALLQQLLRQQQQQFYPPSPFPGQAPAGFYTREQVNEIMRKRDEQTKLQAMTVQMNKLTTLVEKVAKGEVGGAMSNKVVERTYTNSEGILVTERVLPSGKVSTLDEIVKMKKAGILGSNEMTFEKTLQLIRENSPGPPQETPAMTELKIEMKANAARFDALQQKMYDDNQNRLLDQMKDLRQDVREARTGIGWKTDEGRIIGEIGTKIANKEPVKAIVEIIRPQTLPKEKTVEKTATLGLASRLDKEMILEK